MCSRLSFYIRYVIYKIYVTFCIHNIKLESGAFSMFSDESLSNNYLYHLYCFLSKHTRKAWK